MIRERFLIPSLLTLTALGLGACKETGEHESAKHEAHEGHEGHESAEAEEAEHEDMLPAKPAVSLSAAIATAQKSVPDGRVLQAVIETEEGKTICSIVLASGDGQREVNIDAATGKILGTESEPLDPASQGYLEGIAKDPAHPPVGAAQAIEAALAKAPGAWALALELCADEGKLVYSVFLIDGKSAKLAQVSAADGKVQKVSDLELEEGEEHEGMEEAEKGEAKEAPPAKPK